MTGLGKQGKRKAIQRAADLSVRPAGDGEYPTWRPDPDECEGGADYTICPDGADPSKHRVKIRFEQVIRGGAMVEFAVIHQIYYRGKWRDVTLVDSCHDTEVHMHRYGRSTFARVGDPESLMPIENLSDVARGYDLAYERVVESWETNAGRWHDG